MECCGPYHQGKDPEDASTLMRARFSAYVLDLADFVISTTSKQGTTYDDSDCSLA